MNRFIAFARIGVLGFAAAAIPLSTGCGLDVEVGGGAGTGGHNGSGGSCATVAVGVGGDASTSTTVGAGGQPGTGGSSTNTGSTGSGSTPVYCGGNAPVPIPPCAADEYCDYGPDNCGSWDNQGICRKVVGGACPPVYDPTCGCNGQVYSSACEAWKGGTDVNLYSGCQPPAGQFSCGAHFCNQQTDVCVRTETDIADVPPTFACAPIPAGCGGIPTCACISTMACGDTCEDTSDGGHRVTCYEGG